MTGQAEELYRGKAKRVLAGPDPKTVVLEFTDRATAGDGARTGLIRGKGEVNCRVSALAFEFLESRGLGTHFLSQEGPRRLLVRRLEIIPLECVVRNRAAGSLCRRLGLEEGTPLRWPVVELYYKSDPLHDPMVNRWHARALGWASPEEVEALEAAALEANRLLTDFFGAAGLVLVDFKLEFGRFERRLLVGDEVSPDTCRLWDRETGLRLDKDRFRLDLGGESEAYRQVLARLERAWGGGGGAGG
ncbi:MAG: phosphoribosylaminoimidazolesuccinocarboxamide synthase [Acetobacteraceae bacterium]|nr:phosphoribosylaminoimidazolesuccinocarboxamide synthase [Acetobacteraceae bacterium]